jgi:hypothetical protein
VTFLITLVQEPQRAWANLLLGNLFFVMLALYGAVFVAVNFVFSAGWAVAFRRVPEAMSAYLPIGAGLMFALLFGLPELYPWARPEIVALNPHLQHKTAYLNVPFFFARMALAFGVWIFFSRLLRHHSQQQDRDGRLEHTRKNQTYSTVFLILFAATFIVASFDWVMSLEPEWYSTIFPILMASGLLLGGTAAMTRLIVWMREQGQAREVTPHPLYELSRLLCATSAFWAFIWFSQYLLIYYTNIPEESVYYARRHAGSPLFMLNLLLNGVVPLLMMVPTTARRSPRWLLRACGVVLVGRWLDLYLLIMPALDEPSGFGFPELLIPLGILPLFLLSALGSFRRAEPVPRQDPYFAESLHLAV